MQLQQMDKKLMATTLRVAMSSPQCRSPNELYSVSELCSGSSLLDGVAV